MPSKILTMSGEEPNRRSLPSEGRSDLSALACLSVRLDHLAVRSPSLRGRGRGLGLCPDADVIAIIEAEVGEEAVTHLNDEVAAPIPLIPWSDGIRDGAADRLTRIGVLQGEDIAENEIGMDAVIPFR